MKFRSENKSVSTDDLELKALIVCSELIGELNWDAQWRVFHYLLVRHLGRNWLLAKPSHE